MEKLRNDFPQARFVFQSFPLVRLHPWAERASAYLDCIARATPDHAFTFVDAIYGHQKEIEAAVRKTGADGKPVISDANVTAQLRHYTEWAGADPAKTQSCAENTGDHPAHQAQPATRRNAPMSPEPRPCSSMAAASAIPPPTSTSRSRLSSPLRPSSPTPAGRSKVSSFRGFKV